MRRSLQWLLQHVVCDPESWFMTGFRIRKNYMLNESKIELLWCKNAVDISELIQQFLGSMIASMYPMKSLLSKIVFVLTFELLLIGVCADVIHDGTDPSKLGRISNDNGFGSSSVELVTRTVDGGAFLEAQMAGVPGDFSYRSVMYPNSRKPLGANYTVSADFRPSAPVGENRGGVAGWVNLKAKKAITFFVVPGEGEFRLAVVDFTAYSGALNESASNLFHLDGSPARQEIGSSWSELGAYDPSKYATFELSFSVPGTSQSSTAVAATARITAKVFQGVDNTGKPVQVGKSLDLLTDLPVPAKEDHRVGYYAYNGNIFADPGVIGFLDSLSGSGDYEKTNEPPNVRLAVLSPGRTLYDNTVKSLGKSLTSTIEIGDQIVLDTADRPFGVLSNFFFEYIGRGFGGDETAQIRFYANDGEGGRPSTLLFDSFEFEIPQADNGASVDLGDLDGLVVPKTFTWSITYRGVEPSLGEVAGVSLYSPAAVGTGFSDYWAREQAGWALKAIPQAEASFGALIAGGTADTTNGLRSLSSPANLVLSAAAFDSDGKITRVEFYQGNSLIGQSTNAPFSLAVTNLPSGEYAFSAKVTDDAGATALSTPINFVVTKPQIPDGAGGGPVDAPLSYKIESGKLSVSWPDRVKGSILQSTTNLLNPVWVSVPGSSATTSQSFDLSGGSLYFRLIKGSEEPSNIEAPRLTYVLQGGELLVSWPASSTGFILESSANLLDRAWQAVATTGNSVKTPTSAAARFYRLRRP